MPVTSSRHRVLDLQPRVQLDEVEVALGREQELERACVAVADGLARALGRGFHRLARLGCERRRGRLLDQLLVAPLDRAFPLTERQHVAVLVAQDLNLDVPGRRECLLDVEPGIAERGLRLGRGCAERVLDVLAAPARAACPCRRRRRWP